MFESEPSTLSELQAACRGIADACGRLDPATVPTERVTEAFELLAATEKQVGAAVVRMAARYEAAGAWRSRGARAPEDEIARATGRSTARARRSLGTSRKLEKLPGVDDALRNGDLSPDQADHVADGASACPDDEAKLLRSARREPLHQLKRRVADARAKADRDREATRRRQHGMRRLHRWVDEDGLYNLHLKAPADWGAEIDATLKPMVDRAIADARNAGRFEPVQAYGADVVRQVLTGAASGAGPTTSASTSTTLAPRQTGNRGVRPERKVIGVIDVAALGRGHLEPGETAEIAGVGPVSVSALRSLLSDAFVALVIKDGTDIRNVTHLGRQATAHQRTALELRGYRCEVDGCGSTHHLEIDHVTGWTLTHTTTLDDLAWLCTHHHDRKTAEGLHLVGPVGARRLVRPSSNAPPDARGDPDRLFTLAD